MPCVAAPEAPFLMILLQRNMHMSDLRPTRPVSIWFRPLKTCYANLMRDLCKTAVHAATGNVAEAAATVLDIPANFSFKDDPNQAIWTLIHRALCRAVTEIMAGYRDVLATDNWKRVEELAGTYASFLEEQDVTVTEELLENPRSFALLPRLQEMLKDFLLAMGFDEKYLPAEADKEQAAANIAAMLPGAFVHAVHLEWSAAPETYACIDKAFNTPVTEALKQERHWKKYNAWLKMQPQERLFFDVISLEQVFVNLRAYYEEQQPPGDRACAPHRREPLQDSPSDAPPIRHVVDLEEHIMAWLKAGDREDAVRVVSGAPGSGKTSCLKRLAARLADAPDRRSLFIPLHRLKFTTLKASVGEFAESNGFTRNPLSPPEGAPPLVLILDGLDELVMQGRAGVQAAREFMTEVGQTVRNANQSINNALKLQIIVGGREVAVQESRPLFCAGNRVLHVLPYAMEQNEKDTTQWRRYEDAADRYFSYDDPENLLHGDQRHIWWGKYFTAKGRTLA